MHYDRIIAIDPDTEKNGVSEIVKSTKTLKLASLTFAEVVDMVLSLKGSPTPYVVVVEGGWLNKSNWHLKSGDNSRVAAAKGRNTGANHETGKKIVEICKHFGVNVEVVKPLRKIWKGRDRKITHDELNTQLIGKGYAPIKRTNQEERDSALICLFY